MKAMTLTLNVNVKREMLMEKKTARLTLLIDPQKKRAFEELCALQDLTPSQVVRQLIRDYLHKHGVEYGSQPQEDEHPPST